MIDVVGGGFGFVVDFLVEVVDERCWWWKAAKWTLSIVRPLKEKEEEEGEEEEKVEKAIEEQKEKENEEEIEKKEEKEEKE